MRIGDSSQEPRFPSRKNVRSAGRSARSGEASSASAAAGDNLATDSQSAELNELFVRLKQIPDVREDVIADVEERLRDGRLMTREAAEKTARQILEQLAVHES